MAVSTIGLYPSSVYDFDLSSRSVPSPSTVGSPPQKPMIGGLSCLFSSSSSSVKHASTSSYSGGEEFSSLRTEELGSSFGCSFGSYKKRDHQSPVSVFHGPVSCSSSGIGSSRSSLMRFTPGRDSSFRSGNDRLFSRNALGSCLDYSPSVGFVEVGSAALVEELTFKMDDTSSYESIPYAKDLLLGAQTRHKIFFDELVIKAFHEADKAHKGQTRASGGPYLQHCVETAVQLAMIGANSTVVAAGLLHDILDDSSVSYDYILQTFGVEVAGLVKGVSELSHLSKLARESDTANRTVEADRLHTVFLAMADLRAVLIKLADRLHNMMTLEALPVSKQQRFANETLQIFAPLAHRLGVPSWIEQLENLCFKFLNPDQHKELFTQLLKSSDEEMVSSAGEKLEQALKDGGISYHALSGRHKSLYSIHRKILKKKLTIDEIHDIHGLRLIVEKEEDCYKALEIVHQLWLPEKFKDYIHSPKCNGYRSLHTVVVGEGFGPLEVQIRTREMHLQAEFGSAAHWRYKEGDCEHSSFVVQMVEWAQSVITWHCETMVKEKSLAECSNSKCTFPFHSDDCRYLYKPQCSDDGPVFVIAIENDKGIDDWLTTGSRPPMSVLKLPANSTIMDLLERAGRGSSRWTPYRYLTKEELRPTVNNVPVSDPTQKLKMGDVVNLTPTISDTTDYREEIQRMYDRGLSVSSTGPAASAIARG